MKLQNNYDNRRPDILLPLRCRWAHEVLTSEFTLGRHNQTKRERMYSTNSLSFISFRGVLQAK